MDAANRVIDSMVANPLALMAKYPRYAELQRDLAGAFLLEVLQEQNPEMRRRIESGLSKRVKVFVDVAWDAAAYDQWKKEEEVRFGIAMEMQRELIPLNFMGLSEADRAKYFRDNWEKIERSFERARKRSRYSGP